MHAYLSDIVLREAIQEYSTVSWVNRKHDSALDI